MLYTEKRDAIKKEALYLLQKDKPTKVEMKWFFTTVEKYEDTDEIWVTHKID